MKLSRAGEYGILGATYIALQDKEISFIREIAGSWELPESFLAKILQKLAKAGILNSHKGNMGGFSLAKPADEITLCEIIEAVQDPIVTSWFEERENSNGHLELPPLEPIIHQATGKVRDVLSEYTIADLAMARSVE